MRILVVGAGLAGITLASFLDTQKHDVTVIEKEKVFRTMGYGIFFLHEGEAIAEKLVSKKKLDRHSRKLKIGYYKTQEGKQFATLDYNHAYDIPDSQSIVSITRHDLHKLLREGLSKKVRVWKGMTITHMTNTSNKASVTFSNNKKETFDLIIGTDGVGSPLRKKYFESNTQEIPWQTRYLWLPSHSNHFQLVTSPRNIAMHLPIQDKTVGLVVENGTKSIEELRHYYHKLGMSDEEIARSYKTSYVGRMNYLYTTEWINNRVIIIGDAQHAMTPTMGYGTTLALEDAYALAYVLNKNTTFEDAHKPLRKLFARRTRRVKILRGVNKLVEFFLFRKSKKYYEIVYSKPFVSIPMIYGLNALSRICLKYA